MPDLSRLRLIRGQGGSTLVELLVAMPMAVLALGLATQAFVTGSKDQRELERRTSALNHAQVGMEKMTRELRQANWVYFTSSQVVDAEVMVRQSPTTEAVLRHVRYDCSAGACWRYEGPPVSYPPPPASALETATMVVGSGSADPDGYNGVVIGHDVFLPRKVDMATGATTSEYLDPDMLWIRLRLSMKGLDYPLEIADGVSLRNTNKFAG